VAVAVKEHWTDSEFDVAVTTTASVALASDITTVGVLSFVIPSEVLGPVSELA
jgi:hypothetical protein